MTKKTITDWLADLGVAIWLLAAVLLFIILTVQAVKGIAT